MADLSQLSDQQLMSIAGNVEAQAPTLSFDNMPRPRKMRPAIQDLRDELGGNLELLGSVAPVAQSQVMPPLPQVAAQEPDLSQIPDEELMAAAGIQPEPAPAPVNPLQAAFEAKKLGILDRISNDYDKRVADSQARAERMVSGEQGAIETAAQNALNLGAGMGSDIIGEGLISLKSMADMASSNPMAKSSPILQGYEGIKNVLGRVVDSPVGDLARKVGASYGEFSKENPRAADNINAAGNLLGVATSFAPTPKGGLSAVGATGKAVTTGGKFAQKQIAKEADKAIKNLATPKMVAPNAEQLGEMSSISYKSAREAGEVFSPQTVTNNFVASIENAKPKKIGGTVETALSQDLEASLGKYRDLADRPLSIDEVDIIDKDLSNLKDQAYSAGKNQLASEYGNIQNSLRNSVANSPSGQKLAEARDLFKRKHQMEDVERIFRNAEGRPNEAAIIQTGYRNLANQARKKGSGYTKEQIKIMDNAAKGGLSIDALKFASGKLIAGVAAAVGGPVAGATAYMGNLAAGAGATALQTAKANKLASSITKGLKVQSEPTKLNIMAADLQKKIDIKNALKSPQETKLLPAPAKKEEFISGRQGVRSATSEEIAKAEAARKRASDLGITPDVSKVNARNEIRSKTNPVIDKLEKEFTEKKAAQIEEMYKKATPSVKAKIGQIIEKQNRDGVERGALGDLIVKALREGDTSKPLKITVRPSEKRK